MRTLLLSLFLLALYAFTLHAVQAQPVLESTTLVQLQNKRDDQRRYHVLDTYVEQLTPLFELTGENQTWDFSTLAYEDTSFGVPITYLSYREDLPGATHFSDATMVLLSADSTYTYMRLQQDGMYWLGVASDTFVVRAPRPYLFYKLPLTYQTSWSTTIDLDSLQFYGFDAYRDTTGLLTGDQIRIEWSVDGYGTLVTPAGSAPCLRLTQKFIYIGLSAPFPAELEVGRNVTFITPPDLQLSAFIAGGLKISTGFPPTYSIVPLSGYYATHTYTALTASESEFLPESFTLEAYPAPAREVAYVRVNLARGTPLTVHLYNLLGQKLSTMQKDWLPAGIHTLKLPLSDLAPGVYLLRVQTNTASRSTTLMHVR